MERAVALLALAAWLACAGGGPYMPEQAAWSKPGASEADRALDMLECQARWGFAYDPADGKVNLRRDEDGPVFRQCMEELGWTPE